MPPECGSQKRVHNLAGIRLWRGLFVHIYLPAGLRHRLVECGITLRQFSLLSIIILRNIVIPMGKVKPNTGYERVLACFYIDGERKGALTRLSKAVGQDISTVEAWKRNGIPLKYADQLIKLTGLKAKDIWPELYEMFHPKKDSR